MVNLGNLVQTRSWREEKHMPVIEAPEEVKKTRDSGNNGCCRQRDTPPQHPGASHKVDRGLFYTGKCEKPCDVRKIRILRSWRVRHIHRAKGICSFQNGEIRYHSCTLFMQHPWFMGRFKRCESGIGFFLGYLKVSSILSSRTILYP